MSSKSVTSTCFSSMCWFGIGIFLFLVGFPIGGILSMILGIGLGIWFLVKISSDSQSTGNYSKNRSNTRTTNNYSQRKTYSKRSSQQPDSIVRNSKLSLEEKITQLIAIGMPNDHIPIILDLDHLEMLAALKSGKVKLTSSDKPMIFSSPLMATKTVLTPGGIQQVPVQTHPGNLTEHGLMLLSIGQINLAIAAFEKGEGNYIKDRKEWLEELSIDEIVEEIKKEE